MGRTDRKIRYHSIPMASSKPSEPQSILPESLEHKVVSWWNSLTPTEKGRVLENAYHGDDESYLDENNKK